MSINSYTNEISPLTIIFETPRLKAEELTTSITSASHSKLIMQIPQVLTASVVDNLPPYFHNINTRTQAQNWLTRMLSDSRLIKVTDSSGELIGFIFIHETNRTTSHIGYLLAESHWGKGLATELLKEFIKTVQETESWEKLIAGVEASNQASCRLLKKLGFIEQLSVEPNNLFFEYALFRQR